MSGAPQQAVSIVQQKPGQFEFNPEQRRIILDSFLSGANQAEAAVLLELARARRLNPITGQIHFVKRWNAERQREVWAAQVSIDGFRALAERTGLYDGQDEPEDTYVEVGGRRVLVCSKVRVYRKDWSRPAVGVAHFSEFCQRKKDGNATRMWAEKPHIMLAKCAEAQALRKAFPEDTAGLYTPEEGVGEEMPEQSAVESTGRAEGLKAKLAAKLQPEAAKPSPPRRTSIQDVPPATEEAIRTVVAVANGEEPPPPSDSDAPPYVSAETDVPEEPVLPPREAPITMTFGSGKGRPLADLSKKDLAWYIKALTESLADPEKKRFADDNQRKLNAIKAELERRSQAQKEVPF